MATATGHRSRHPLHPGAWWVWAAGLAVGASRTTDPLLLALVVCVATVVVTARRSDAPWARSFGFFLRLGAVIIVIRVGAQVIFGAGFGRTTLLALPAVSFPSWLGGLSVGGPVTAESLALAAVDGLRFATIIICIGAATTLASPSRLLKSVPAALYEFGTSVVIATTFTPMLVEDVGRVRTARRLRGAPHTGPLAIARSIMPVLEGALERSVTLAAAMDSRGYGRRGERDVRLRRSASAALLIGLTSAIIGCFALLSANVPALLAAPLLVAGTGCAIVAVVMAARGTVRTRYRPDVWTSRAWLVAISGGCAALGTIVSGTVDPSALQMPTSPLTWPGLPIAATVGILIAGLPALLAPKPGGAP